MHVSAGNSIQKWSEVAGPHRLVREHPDALWAAQGGGGPAHL